MSGLRTYLIFGAILLALYFVAQYTKPKPINWDKTLLPEDKIPFGTYVLRQQIADVFLTQLAESTREDVVLRQFELKEKIKTMRLLDNEIKMVYNQSS
jgi:hypothetical protein